MTNTDVEVTLSQTEVAAAIKAATGEVFSTMLGMEAVAGEDFTEKAGGVAPASGVVSLIGLAGSWVGTGSLACTSALACKLSSQLLMTEFESINEEVLDSMAELTNMIVGNVKTVLEEKVGAMGLSTPTVIFGQNFQTRSARNHEWTVVPFTCGDAHLFVQLCLAPNRETVPKNLHPGFPMPQVMTV